MPATIQDALGHPLGDPNTLQSFNSAGICSRSGYHPLETGPQWRTQSESACLAARDGWIENGLLRKYQHRNRPNWIARNRALENN